jgi:hypothetical protein
MLPMTPQFLFGLGKSAVKRLGVTFFAYAIAQPETVFATLVNAAAVGKKARPTKAWWRVMKQWPRSMPR